MIIKYFLHNIVDSIQIKKLHYNEFTLFKNELRSISNKYNLSIYLVGSYLNYLNNHNKNYNDIILLIDEGELYFHPQWQKKYIFNLIHSIPQIFKKNANGRKIDIQLILTTNSPIIISDIPRSHIIFLKRNQNGLCEVVKHLEDKKQTFSSNIHLLFTDAFFMQEGLIGKFAQEKINKVIIDLERSAKLDVERIEEIEQIISIIGEPIIKRKLIQMYEDKFKLTLKDKISNLENEISILKKRLTDDKNKKK